MRILLDTNILIPLEDSRAVLQPSLTNFIRLANQYHHELFYHPASERDIARDADTNRRTQTLQRIGRYQRLSNPPPCPWNTSTTDDNDSVDNEILYALERNAVHALVTEDQRIHRKARERGLENRIYFIQTAEDWLTRLHSQQPVSLPNIREVHLYEIDVTLPFFDSLRQGYDGFNDWFSRKAQEGRKTWIYGGPATLEAICIYAVQTNEPITDNGTVLSGGSLKLCTFKVGEAVRGRKIGELFLKAAFRYASENGLENIFITAKPNEQPYLIDLLTDFGFSDVGAYRGDRVLLKRHPMRAPVELTTPPFQYLKTFYPHYRSDAQINKFIVPIRPGYHDILFPDYHGPAQLGLFASNVGNAIKLAYLSHAQINRIQPGDILLFYRSEDSKAITSLGVVERFMISSDHDEIAGAVRRRTVYNSTEIAAMAAEGATKVMLFRLVKHYPRPIPYRWLRENEIVKGYIQSIRQIDEDSFGEIEEYA